MGKKPAGKKTTRPGLIPIDFGPIAEPLKDYCREHGLKVAAFVRELAAKAIGAKALLKDMKPPGRPWPSKDEG